jgi:hypothetical protein
MEVWTLLIGALLPIVGLYVGREWQKEDRERNQVERHEERVLDALGEFVTAADEFLRCGAAASVYGRIHEMASEAAAHNLKAQVNKAWGDTFSARYAARIKAIRLLFLVADAQTRDEIQAIVMADLPMHAGPLSDDIGRRRDLLDAFTTRLMGAFAPVTREKDGERVPRLLHPHRSEPG